MSELSQQHCVPCRGGVPALEPEAVAELLGQLSNRWSVNPAGHLWARFDCADFSAALAFANRVGAIAEAEGHHPDLLVAWGRCEVEIWTHKVGGLTPSDFVLAAKAEEVAP